MADLVRIFLADTSQGEISESFRCFLVEVLSRLCRDSRDGTKEQKRARDFFHFASDTVAQSTRRQTGLTRPNEFRQALPMKKITSFALFAIALAIYSLAFALDEKPMAKA